MSQRYPAIEGFGYFVAILGVVFLAVAAWLTTKGRPALRAFMIVSAALHVNGMPPRRHVWRRRGGRHHR